MKYYVGIDLGTTNSAICSYDGVNVRVWKSPEQNDVTPSAIYVDKRGNKYYGSKAYNQAPYNPTNSATLFKRFMGTSTKIEIESSGIVMTPEECSAEILKVLYGYLPEEIRNNDDVATVITVPAAFNQMKKDATLQAAKMAGINNVALMQEPVAAIMSVMKTSNQEGIFLVYDLGGGTFDVSIAENINGKVNLLAHGGVEMCGGRDIDRMIFNQVVVPWLNNNFSLPADFVANPKYRTFCRAAQWATERAKIELSSNEMCTIALSEGEARTFDENGEEMYLDIDLNRTIIDRIMDNLINETVSATRETMRKAGLNSNDIERIVFVGGPTNYKPLRDRVAMELALPANIDVNPMTAVAEGASIFAESINWNTDNHNRKATNDIIKTNIDLELKYVARTSMDSAMVMCVMNKPLEGYAIQFTSLNSGWTSGVASLIPNLKLKLPLNQNGENVFNVKVLDAFGRGCEIGVDKVVITRTLATIGAIPASQAIGIEVIDKLGGASTLEFLVNEGDSLPKKGNIPLKAGRTIKAGTTDAINIKLWEGNIQSPIEDNRFIGSLKITGQDIATGVIPTGADIECDYEMSDSGTIKLEVSIPCIGATFGNRNFYSRQSGQIDLEDIDSIAEKGRNVVERIDEMLSKVEDSQLDLAREKAMTAAEIDSKMNSDLEDVQKAHNDLLEAKKLINQARKNNLQTMRQIELDERVFRFESIRMNANEKECQMFDSLVKTAQRAIDRNDSEFESILSQLNNKISGVLVRQDWFIIDIYKDIIKMPRDYVDINKYNDLKKLGDQALDQDNIDELKKIIGQLLDIRINSDDSSDSRFEMANIIRG